MWLIMEYRKPKEILRYAIKWGKVLFLFDDKKAYIQQMIHGTKDGYHLWADVKD